MEFLGIHRRERQLDPGGLGGDRRPDQRLDPVGLDEGLGRGPGEPKEQTRFAEQGEHPAGGIETIPAVEPPGGNEREAFEQFSDRHSGATIVSPGPAVRYSPRTTTESD